MNVPTFTFLKNTNVRAILFTFALATSTVGAFSQMKSIEPLEKRLASYSKNDTSKVNLLNELSYQQQWFNFYESLEYAKKALEIAQELSYEKGIAVARFRMAHCYWALGDNDFAVNQALLSEKIAVKINDHETAAESYRTLAINYRDQQDNGKALTYIEKAEKAAIRSQNWDLISRVYNTAGVVFCTNGDYDKALAYYRKSLSITETHQTYHFHLAQVLSNIGEMYSPERLNVPRLESGYFSKALIAARQNRNRSAEAAILNNIARVFIRQKHFAEADKFLKQSLSIGEELNVKRIVKSIYLSFIELKIEQGKSVEAKYYVEKYNAVRDSLLNEKKTRQIVEMETRFETEKKEQIIKLLEQEKQIQTIWTNIWIIGAVLLFVSVVLIYRLQQSRARKAKQMLGVQTELNNKLKEADELKSRFFANISHEFRTPLSLILAPVEEMIRSNSLIVSHKNDLRMVRRNANRLLELVNQLLELSKIDAGKMKLQMQKQGLKEFLDLLSASFDSLAEARLIRFSKEIQAPSDDAWFDKDKLDKIVTNVLGNAFNFTGTGGSVSLTVSTNSIRSELFIEISDTGKGISEEDLEHIFSPFYQARRFADHANPGTGLGLALVSELVKLHQGQIDLKSELGVGTVVTITLPIARERLVFEEILSDQILNAGDHGTGTRIEDVVFEESSSNLNSAECILIVEDNCELRNFIGSCFGKEFRIILAENGQEGLKLAIEHIPDLIISDVMMPKMDGNLFTEKIKNDDRTSHIPVILLTAKSNSDARMDGFRNGADDYLAKPFSTEELHVRVKNLIDTRKKLAAKYRKGLVTQAGPGKLLSLDDKFMVSVNTIIEANLSNPGFGVEQLADEMCMSRTQLFRKIKALLEIAPNELINDIRLRRAAEMIRFKSESLAQISYAVGFSEQSYFAKRFRKKFGVSPTEYANP